MKYAWLVAWREFSESAKTKGFWIGIFMFPLLIFLSIQTPIWLEKKATPVRYYVLVDQSSNLANAVETKLEQEYQREVLSALKDYARKYSNAGAQSNNADVLKKLGSTEGFQAAGGKDAFLDQIKPYLKPDAPEFKDPRRAFQSVKLPAGINAQSEISELAESLKPYLRGQKTMEADGQPVSLSAAVLIPRDIEDYVMRPASKFGAKTSGGILGGEWRGTLDVGQATLRLVFKFEKGADGGWAATLDSLDQGSFGMRANSVNFGGGQLRLEFASIGGVYEAPLADNATQMTGTWSQGGRSFPLALQQFDNGAAASRPVASKSGSGHASGIKEHDSQIQFWSANASDPRLRDEIESGLNSEIRRREYLARGLDAALVRQIEQTRLPFASLSPKKEKGKEALNSADTIKQWAPSGFVYLLWMSIWVVIQMLLTNTIEEKSNRIIEVLLSSVTPGELMVGKLTGIAAIGLTMVGAWVLSLFLVLTWKSGGASDMAGQVLSVIKGSNIVYLFSIYFLLGYLMCASFILSIGSVCNTLKEAQSYMGVMTMFMMVPLLTMTFIPKDPNGNLARLLSWIPIYSPFTMMNRAAADPPMVDLVGTFILMVVSTVAGLWMAGKIFRIGILRTGQPPKLVEMLRWALRKRE